MTLTVNGALVSKSFPPGTQFQRYRTQIIAAATGALATPVVIMTPYGVANVSVAFNNLNLAPGTYKARVALLDPSDVVLDEGLSADVVIAAPPVQGNGIESVTVQAS